MSTMAALMWDGETGIGEIADPAVRQGANLLYFAAGNHTACDSSAGTSRM